MYKESFSLYENKPRTKDVEVDSTKISGIAQSIEDLLSKIRSAKITNLPESDYMPIEQFLILLLELGLMLNLERIPRQLNRKN